MQRYVSSKSKSDQFLESTVPQRLPDGGVVWTSNEKSAPGAKEETKISIWATQVQPIRATENSYLPLKPMTIWQGAGKVLSLPTSCWMLTLWPWFLISWQSFLRIAEGSGPTWDISLIKVDPLEYSATAPPKNAIFPTFSIHHIQPFPLLYEASLAIW